MSGDEKKSCEKKNCFLHYVIHFFVTLLAVMTGLLIFAWIGSSY